MLGVYFFYVSFMKKSAKFGEEKSCERESKQGREHSTSPTHRRKHQPYERHANAALAIPSCRGSSAGPAGRRLASVTDRHSYTNLPMAATFIPGQVTTRRRGDGVPGPAHPSSAGGRTLPRPTILCRILGASPPKHDFKLRLMSNRQRVVFLRDNCGINATM